MAVERFTLGFLYCAYLGSRFGACIHIRWVGGSIDERMDEKGLRIMHI